jgi:lysophospholipase L1-like esterase
MESPPLYPEAAWDVKFHDITMGKNIIFAGDSLIEFFDWQGRFPSHRVWNLGRSGETVEGLLRRTEQIIREHPSADMLFIMSGINNLAMEDMGFLDTYKELFGKLASAYPKARIYAHSLLPTILPWIEDRAIRKANRQINALAGECGAVFLDIYPQFVEKGVRECLLPDGVHISDTGYAVWSEAIERIIEERP